MLGFAFCAPLLVFPPTGSLGTVCISLSTRRSDPLYGVAWALLVSMVYGIAETIYGVLLGYPLFTALQILVFSNICPVYLFLGIWVGFRDPATCRK